MTSAEAPTSPPPQPSLAAEARARSISLQAKKNALALTLLDKLEAITNSIAPPNPTPAATLLAKRRVIANLLGASSFCPHARCRKRRACLGEPVECISSGMPFFSPDLLGRIVQPRKRPTRR